MSRLRIRRPCRSAPQWRDVLLWGGALLAVPAFADAPAVDGDFLEYLGSVDSSDAGWHDYLEQTDIDQVAKPPAHAPAKPATPPAADVAADVPRKVKQK